MKSALQIAVVILVEFNEDLIFESGCGVLDVGVVDGKKTLVALVDHELGLAELESAKRVAIDALAGLLRLDFLSFLLHYIWFSILLL